MVVKSSKKQKKIWFNIIAPKEFGNQTIGETTAFGPQQLIGRNIRVSLMNLLRDPKKQNMQLTFKIKEVRDKNAITELIKYELVSGFIKRLARKGRNKIGDSFVAETKDKIKVKIKPIMITRSKTQKSKLTMLKKTAKEFIIERVKTQNLTELTNDIISTKTQREIKGKLKKIHPLTVCEFKAIIKMR
ncbi:MAG: hypothetical protein ISS23_02695 [Nanoarchaeota archaeon]|nr:hypothetical protein [Nanoarchaeota archaeon]